MFYIHPEWGRWSQFDLRIFCRMGGEKPPTRTSLPLLRCIFWGKGNVYSTTSEICQPQFTCMISHLSPPQATNLHPGTFYPNNQLHLDLDFLVWWLEKSIRTCSPNGGEIHGDESIGFRIRKKSPTKQIQVDSFILSETSFQSFWFFPPKKVHGSKATPDLNQKLDELNYCWWFRNPAVAPVDMVNIDLGINEICITWPFCQMPNHLGYL